MTHTNKVIGMTYNGCATMVEKSLRFKMPRQTIRKIRRKLRLLNYPLFRVKDQLK